MKFNPKNLRRFHLYVGCFFAPVLIFFILSGSWQIFHLQVSSKDGSYKAPAILKTLSRVHYGSRVEGWTEKSSGPFKIFLAAMGLFLCLTIAAGIRLALQSAPHPWQVWACLILGILIPLLLLRFP